MTGATLYNGEIVTDAYTEKGICYDTDGNVLSLNRTSEGQIDSVTYVYSNGRLLSVCSTGLEQGQFCYDKSGRVIHDGAFGLDILWNSLGQISQVKNKDSICVMYTYTPDGTKISSLDLEGNGLLYDGPFVYKIDRDSIVLESVAFKGGRFCVSDTGGMEVQYHITDHPGSVRLVINDEGENIERNNYYPFGLRWNDGSLLNNQNLYRYNGKEDQRYFGLPYLDYGARMYVPRMTRWLSPDPFAEQYYNSSPYSFCAGNPINYVDLDGKERRLVYNMKKNEIIIQATFYHEIGITKEVHAALNMFNNMSGLKYADDDGNVYKVKFDLIGERNSSPSKAARGNPAGNYIELSNSLGITENGDRRLGATWKNHIKIDEDFINNIIVVSHEVGHALGAALPDENGNDNHSDYGLMAPSVDDPNLNTYLDQKSVDEIIQDGQGPMVVQNSWLDAVLQIFK